MPEHLRLCAAARGELNDHYYAYVVRREDDRNGNDRAVECDSYSHVGYRRSDVSR